MSKNLSQRNSQRQEPVLQASAVAQFRSGPLPPPSEVEHYNRILPSAADRLFTMAEREQEAIHKQKMTMLETDRAFVQHQTKVTLTALYIMLAIVLTLILCGVVLIILDKQWEGLSVLACSVLAMLRYFSPFIHKKKQEDSSEIPNS